MPHATISGQRLHYTLSRNDLAGQRPPLLLIHGAGGSHLHWPPHLRRLPDYNVYALDLPGHGRSQGTGRTTVAAYREIIFELCQALELERAVLAGHSMGGAIAQDFALHYPSRLAGLVLVGTGARLRVAPAILDGLRSDFAATAQMISDFAHGDNPPEQMKRLFLRRMLENDPQVVYGDFVACNLFDVRADVARIAAPALIICGAADKLTPSRYSEYLAAQLPNARLIITPGAGHMVMLEAADEVTTAIAGFMEGLA